MNRWRLLLVAGLLSAATAVGAGAANDPKQGESGQERTQRLSVALAGYENNLSPFALTFQSGITADLVNLVYDTLFYSPWEKDPKPWLATNSEVSNDDRTWTIDIRAGVRWHDGKPLTAEDVRFSYQYFFDNEAGFYSHHVNDLPFVESFEVLDEDTARFTCRKPCPTFNIDPGAHIPIIPKHVWEDVEDPANFTGGLPVGSGPYKVTDVVPGQRYTLRAHDDYFLGRPFVEEIDMPIIPEPSAMFLALRSGKVDAVSRVIPPQTISSLEKAGLGIVKQPDYRSTQVSFNVQREPFDSAGFRNALNLAVDTGSITRALLAGRGQPGVESLIDPDSPFAAKELDDRYDPRRAEALLEEDGFRDRNGDGVREQPNGKPLDFELLVSKEELRELRAAEFISGQLGTVGVRTEVVPLDPVTLSERQQPPQAGRVDLRKTAKTGDYDMYLASNSGAHVHFDPDGLLYYFHCPGRTGFGAYITGYCNKQFDRLVERAATLGFEERTPVLQKAQRVLYRDPPTISLYFPQGTYAYRPAAYTSWAPEIAHGIVHKRSFLPIEGIERVGSLRATDDAGGSGTPAWPFVLAVIVLGAGAVFLARRRRANAAGPPEGQ